MTLVNIHRYQMTEDSLNKYLNPMGAIVGLGDKSKEEIGLIVDEDNKKKMKQNNCQEAANNPGERNYCRY